MTLLRDFDMQVATLLDANGKATQWESYSPAAFSPKLRALDPESGARLQSPGEDIEGGGWVPGGRPIGFPRAVRLSPSPYQKGLSGLAARPRCQMDLGRRIPIQQSVLDATGFTGNPGPNSAPADALIVMGDTGYKRAFGCYFAINPDFKFIQENVRLDKDIFVNMIQWHGDTTKTTAPTSVMGLPTVMVHGSPYPNRTDPWHLRVRITGGRHTLMTTGRVPEFPWDDLVIVPESSPAQFSAVEMQRTYDLMNGAPFPMDGAWHYIVIVQDFQWDISVASTLEIWMDGVKRVGVGGQNYLLDGPASRDESIYGPPHPLNINKWLTNYYDVDQVGAVGTSPQQVAFRVNNYRPAEAWNAMGTSFPDAIARDVQYDAHIWNPENSVWMTGMAIGTELTDFPLYNQPVEIGPSGLYRNYNIYAPASAQTLSFGQREEEWAIVAEAGRKYPRFLGVRGGVVRGLSLQHIV